MKLKWGWCWKYKKQYHKIYLSVKWKEGKHNIWNEKTKKMSEEKKVLVPSAIETKANITWKHFKELPKLAFVNYI